MEYINTKVQVDNLGILNFTGKYSRNTRLQVNNLGIQDYR